MLDTVAVGEQVTISSNVEMLQPLHLTNAGGFFPRNIEDAFDRAIILLQQFGGGQLLRAPVGEVLEALPSAAVRASKLLGFDGDGDPVALVTPDTAGATALDLALRDVTLNGAGAGQVGLNVLLAYARGTVGGEFNYLRGLTINAFNYLTAAEITDVQTGALTIPVGDKIRAAFAVAVAGGHKKFYMPAGHYLMDSAPGADAFGNGIAMPFNTVNSDPRLGIVIEGDGPSTVLCCGDDDMILVRRSGNYGIIKDLTLDANGHSGCWGDGIVPESISQTTTCVSQQHTHAINVNIVGTFDWCRVLQPGPQVAGSDSGCFYMKLSGTEDLTPGARGHIWFKKNVDWGTHPNRPTRIDCGGMTLLRGNVGYYIEVGSEIVLGKWEEFIDDSTSPLTVPTARYVSPDASNIRFGPGYSESCTRPADVLGRNGHTCDGYDANTAFPANWYTNISLHNTTACGPAPLQPTVRGGGGAGTTVSMALGDGYMTREGYTVNFKMAISLSSAQVATLTAGNIIIGGLRDVALSAAGLQMAPVGLWTGLTIDAARTSLMARVSSATIELIKSLNNGSANESLTKAEMTGNPVSLTIQGSYIV
jgi:hypothetical protein